MKLLKTLILCLLAGIFISAGCVNGTGGKDGGAKEAMNLVETAEAIAAGEVSVGGESGMGAGERYHTIHTQVLGLQCTSCHISGYASDYIYQRKYKVPVRNAPGVVDRSICLGCHKENGPAKTKLFGTAGE